MLDKYSSSPPSEQAEIGAWLEEMLSDLTLDFPKVAAPVAVFGSIHPLWQARIDRAKAGRLRRQAIHARHRRPAENDEMPLELPAPANDDAPVLVPGLVTKPPSGRRPRRSGVRQGEDVRRIRAHGRVAKGEVV